jgi:hypothetical protein
VRIRGLREELVEDLDQLLDVIERGGATRSTGATGLMSFFYQCL